MIKLAAEKAKQVAETASVAEKAAEILRPFNTSGRTEFYNPSEIENIIARDLPSNYGTNTNSPPAGPKKLSMHPLEHAAIKKNPCKIIKAKEILHYWYKGWPDHGSPENMELFFNFIKELYLEINENKGNTVIHCSAGIGRTGLVYTVLSLIFKNNISINENTTYDELEVSIINSGKIQETILDARNERMSMVTQNSQYEFICSFFKIKDVNKFENFGNIYGIETNPDDNPRHSKDSLKFSSENSKDIKCKKSHNRYDNVYPYADSSAVKLDETCYFNSDINCPSYINASIMESFGENMYVIAASCPIEEFSQHFYRMLDQYNVKRIVMVTDLIEPDAPENKRNKCYSYVSNADGTPGLVDDNKKHENVVKHSLKLITDNNMYKLQIDEIKTLAHTTKLGKFALLKKARRNQHSENFLSNASRKARKNTRQSKKNSRSLSTIRENTENPSSANAQGIQLKSSQTSTNGDEEV